MTATVENRSVAICVVMPFVFRHWLDRLPATAIVADGFMGVTAADLFMPVFSGN
jgi:ATP-binding cassette, subfamily B, bacterial